MDYLFLFVTVMIKMSKYLVLVQNKSLISKFKEVEKATFLFPLEGFSVGYPITFKLDEIDEFGAYILVNRLLDESSILKLKDLFSNFPKNIKGIVFEDLGVIDLVKDLDITKILWQSHLNASYLSINGFLKYVDSVMVSTDITYDEIKLIVNKVTKPLVLPIFGFIPTMYSRRYLLSNFNINFDDKVSNPNVIKEEVLKDEFRIFENEYGTVLYFNKLYNGSKLKDFDALYYFINSVFVSDEDILNFIKNEELSIEYDDGFLNKKTIYKLKEGEK